MHAYLLIGEGAELEAKKLFPNAKHIINYKIESIADTKELIRQTNLSLAPTVYIINDFDEASMEAQNSFLKRLEEPQKNLGFILTAKSEWQILPTIISRCQIIRPKRQKSSPSSNYQDLTALSIPQRFEIISKITKREDAVLFLENTIKSLSLNLNNNTKDAICAADIARSRIKQNANPTLQLVRFAISF